MYIEEQNLVADVALPSRPLVISLRDYDTAETASPSPLPGYPVVCITVGFIQSKVRRGSSL